MPPVGQYVFAEMPRKIATSYRREAKMPPLLHGRTVLRYLTFKQQFTEKPQFMVPSARENNSPTRRRSS